MRLASGQLIRRLMGEERLMERLRYAFLPLFTFGSCIDSTDNGARRCLKRYMLLERSDWLVCFFDAAESELLKHVEDIAVEKLAALLESAMVATGDSDSQARCRTVLNVLVRKLSERGERECRRRSIVDCCRTIYSIRYFAACRSQPTVRSVSIHFATSR
jgi:hypothetical protein